MGTTAEKLAAALESKGAIRSAIQAKGVDVGDSEPLSGYAAKIASIAASGGGSSSEWTGHVDIEGLAAIGWTADDIAYFETNGLSWNEAEDDTYKVNAELKAAWGNGDITLDNYADYKHVMNYVPKLDFSEATTMINAFRDFPLIMAVPDLQAPSGLIWQYAFNKCYSLFSLDFETIREPATVVQCFAYTVFEKFVEPDDWGAISLATAMVDNYRLLYAEINGGNTATQGNFGRNYNLRYLKIKESGTLTSASGRMQGFLLSCWRLRIVDGIIDCAQSGNLWTPTLLYSLVSIKAFGLYSSVSFAGSMSLDMESILYMIENNAATEGITITLHPTAYELAMEDDDIVAALEENQLVTLASA